MDPKLPAKLKVKCTICSQTNAFSRAGAYALSCHDNNSLMTILSRGEIISSLISFHGAKDLNGEMATSCGFISWGLSDCSLWGE